GAGFSASARPLLARPGWAPPPRRPPLAYRHLPRATIEPQEAIVGAVEAETAIRAIRRALRLHRSDKRGRQRNDHKTGPDHGVSPRAPFLAHPWAPTLVPAHRSWRPLVAQPRLPPRIYAKNLPRQHH